MMNGDRTETVSSHQRILDAKWSLVINRLEEQWSCIIRM